MKTFLFHGVVTYPAKSIHDIPRGSYGFHIASGENEEDTRRYYEEAHNKFNLYLVDAWTNKEHKAPFQWYGEYKQTKI